MNVFVKLALAYLESPAGQAELASLFSELVQAGIGALKKHNAAQKA